MEEKGEGGMEGGLRREKSYNTAKDGRAARKRYEDTDRRVRLPTRPVDTVSVLTCAVKPATTFSRTTVRVPVYQHARS